VLYKGRVAFQQYIPKKHKRFGTKIYKLCDSLGYTYDMSMYLGKQRQHATAQITATHGTVLQLKIFRDNYFTSPTLFDDLFQQTMRVEQFAMAGVELSHTPGSCCCFWPGNGFSSTRHRDLHPLRASSVQFVLLFGRGGERAESESSYVVALVFVSTLCPTTSRGTANSLSNIIAGNSTKSGTSTTPKEPRNRGTTGTEARRSSCDDASSAVEREEEKVLVKCPTRATLPRNVSSN